MNSKIEEFLLNEFREQHENIRSIINLTFQKAQFFINLETFILGGFLTLISLGVKDAINYLFIPFIFLSLFGHTVFISSVYSIVQENNLDFVNNLIRNYFIENYKDDAAANYIYFGRDFDKYFRGSDSWKSRKDPPMFIATFIGILNSFNISCAVLSLFIVFLKIFNLNLNIIFMFPVLFLMFLLIVRVYISKFLYDTVEREQNLFRDQLDKHFSTWMKSQG